MTPAELRAWRQRLGLSLTQAAEALGVERRSYVRWESAPPATREKTMQPQTYIDSHGRQRRRTKPSSHTVNGCPVVTARVCRMGDYWRWTITCADGALYCDGGNFRERGDAIKDLEEVYDPPITAAPAL